MSEIAVLSGKGGTGKTTLSAAFATLGPHMVVADCDVDAANLYLLLSPVKEHEERFLTGHQAVINQELCTQCGLCMEYCRFGAITRQNDRFVVSETACDGCQLCWRICPEHAIDLIPSDHSFWFSGAYRNGQMVHARLAPGEENSGKLVNVVRSEARKKLEEMQWDVLLIDGPPGTGCPVISSITGVDKVLVVTEPTCSGFHDMKRVLQLVEHFKIPASVVVNKCDLNDEMTEQIVDWCSENNVALLGLLPFDERMVEAMLQCKSIVEWAPDAEISHEIRMIWDKLQN